MEKKSKVLVYLPRRLYVEVHERQLTNHISYLVSRLLEEFLQATDVRISWVEMESKAEQREYIERRLKEFLSRHGLSTEFPKPPVQEKAEPARVQDEPSSPVDVQETSTEVFTPSTSEPVKEEKAPSSEESLDDILKRIENLW
jgi:hypothetical protein